jgi:outer membrane protein
MKNLSLGLNFVLLAAVAVLFFLHFKGENKEINENHASVATKGATVVYINTDSLFAKYNMAVELNEAFLKKTEERRADLNSMAKDFEKKYIDYQKKAQSGAFLTRARQEKAGRELEQNKIALDKLNQEMSENTMRERNEMSKKLYDAVTGFLKEYNKTQGYDVILSTTLGGNVLHSKKGLDITNQVVKELNARYKKK